MARAGSKAILLGEHAVVYGIPAIAVGLKNGARAEARQADRATIRVGTRQATSGDGSELSRAFDALLQTLGAPPCSVTVEVDIPTGVGLGASASIGVATARAVIEATEAGAAAAADPRKRLYEAAMSWERVFHGNPSGIDAWGAAFGGCFSFVRGGGVHSLKVAVPLTLAVAVAGPAASTREMVEGLARLRDRKPELAEKSFRGIESLVKNAVLCIEAGDCVGLGKLMDLNQMLLAGLFLSTDELERACDLARGAGALGAKLTGSGGGGCVVALADQDPSPILAAWRQAGLECFSSIVPSSAENTEAPS